MFLTRLWRLLLVPAVITPTALASPPDVQLLRAGGDSRRQPVVVIGVDNAVDEAALDDVAERILDYYLVQAETNECFVAADPWIYLRRGVYADTAEPAHTWNDRFSMAFGGYVQVLNGSPFERPSQFVEGHGDHAHAWSYPGPFDRVPQNPIEATHRAGGYSFGLAGDRMPHDESRRFPSGTSHDMGENRVGGNRENYCYFGINYMILPEGHSGGGWFSNWRHRSPVDCLYPQNCPSFILACDGGMHYNRRLGFAGDDPRMLEWVFLAAFADQTSSGDNHSRPLDGSFEDRDQVRKMFRGFMNRDLTPPPSLVRLLSDINLDGSVDAADLGLLVADFGSTTGLVHLSDCDLNGDGCTDTADLAILVRSF